jgi:AAA15 family ATPase/GTPase
MIIEFSVTNFRSIHQKQVFTMAANGAKSKIDNVFERRLSNTDNIALVKTAVLYGANASGKSNMIQALWELRKLIVSAENIKFDEPLVAYNPFLFDANTPHQPSVFEIIFVAKNNEKYRYAIAFDSDKILKEELFYYPKKKQNNLFNRPFEVSEKDENIHIGRLGKDFNNRKYEVHKKMPLLALFGRADNYHTDISPVHTYFKELEIWNIVDAIQVNRLGAVIKSDLQKPENKWLQYRLERLIRACDTQIQGLQVDTDTKVISAEADGDNRFKVFQNEIISAAHQVFQDENPTEMHHLSLKEESTGTRRLVALGGLVLKTLERGGLLIFDELDASLHPYISRFLVRLFLNTISNPHHAQLIFTAHEPHLMDKDMLRADQIWFAEKNKFGASEIFSAQDFPDVREDIPFDKWYMAGKFGAVPQIKELQFIFENGTKTTITP